MASESNFQGPEELAAAVLKARATTEVRWGVFPGHISAEGICHLLRVAYYASLAPNEGRYPRLSLIVPSDGEEVRLLVPLDQELTVPLLRRIGPTLGNEDHALVVCERGEGLRTVGLVEMRSLLSERSVRDPVTHPIVRPVGLRVEVSAPGELRVAEHHMHRLQAGTVRQEVSFLFDRWFREWYDEAAIALFNPQPGEQDGPTAFAVVNLWMRVLRSAAALRHGGCLVIHHHPADAPIKHVYCTPECDLGSALVAQYAWMRQSPPSVTTSVSQGLSHVRVSRGVRLLATIEAVASLTATDGCVVFNRRLQLHSFGSMIEAGESGGSAVPCYLGDSSDPLSEEKLKTFGARRRSAVRLCQACPGALAFVISQDGDLRIVVRDGDVVRLYEHAAFW